MNDTNDRGLGKQAAETMKNASIPKNNRDKSRKNETDSNEIRNQSIKGVLGAEITGRKWYIFAV